MPYINVDEAYILNNTGLQVDMTTDIPFADAGFSDTQKEQARKNIGAGGTNPNLLDNAYFVGGGSQLGDGVFPINQRGLTSYSWSGATCIDRWYIFSANDTVTLSASGLTVTANDDGGALGQRIKYYPTYSQQPILCTFLTTDNKRIIWSFTINTSISWQGGTLVLNEVPDFYVDALYDSVSNTVAITLAKSFDGTPHSITLKAAKVELGTVSTLANDAPPVFSEELAKCQWRLRDVSLKRVPVFCDSNYMSGAVTLVGVEMASHPTSASIISAGYMFDPSTSTSTVPTGVSVLHFEKNTPTVQFSLSTAMNGWCLLLDCVVRLSCEL